MTSVVMPLWLVICIVVAVIMIIINNTLFLSITKAIMHYLESKNKDKGGE